MKDLFPSAGFVLFAVLLLLLLLGEGVYTPGTVLTFPIRHDSATEQGTPRILVHCCGIWSIDAQSLGMHLASPHLGIV